nr:hypothetical protein [Rhodococcus wratislaviensis]GLK38659.1 hypothetical protein GCM10017611_55260 [Rhodococcus wratislaviensis]
MNAEQQGALEQVRDTHVLLRTFISTNNKRVPAIIWYDTYRQLTGDLLDAVVGARSVGVPEHVIFETM